MKQKIRFFLAFLLIVSLFNYTLNGKEAPTNKTNELSKIDDKVLDEIKKDGEIKVIVELEDKVMEKGNFGASSFKKVDKNSFLMQNEEFRRSLKHNFTYSNSFSAELSPEEIQELAKKSEVRKIYYDYPVQAFLQQSVPLINSSSSWNLQVEGINLTGEGQSVCVIDTGVDYRHNDFGSCNIVGYELNGNVENLATPIESSHPYQNNYDYTWKITKPGYEKIAVHFKNISLEYPGQGGYDTLDRIIIYDSQMRQIAVYHGINGVIQNLWTPFSAGDTIYVRLVSDDSVNSYGFFIDKVINGTTNTTYNWNSCQKVIGGWDFVNNEGDPLDDHNHGTHVAGIIATNGLIKGVSPGTKIVAIKSLGSNGGGYMSDIIAGMEFCINKSKELNISVISMSLGADCNSTPQYCHSTYCDAEDYLTAKTINLAFSKNISVVIATGNDGNSSFTSEPSCIYNATRVGSTTKADGISSFSNRWALEMLVAPGSLINSTKRNGGYYLDSGTSMATPHVSGAIAIINQYLKMTNRSMTPKQIEAILNKTGKNISADGRIYKRIDVLSALFEIDVTPPKINVSGVQNNTKTIERNLTFNYSVSDWQLSNVTLFLFNSSGLYKNETKEVSGQYNESLFFIENLNPGVYSWYINVSDRKGNTQQSEIRNFEIKKSLRLIIIPLNNTYTNNNETIFNCSSFSEVYNLTNTTIYLWNFSNERELLKNETKYISGKENFSLMNCTFIEEGEYLWGCEVFNENNESEFLNYTIFFDITNPNLTNIEISTTHNSATIIFNTSEETNATIELIGKENKTNSIFSFEKTFYFSELSANTDYSFNLTFCDMAGNCNSQKKEFKTSNIPGGGGGSGGRGGGGSVDGGSGNIEVSEKKEVFVRTDDLILGITKEISTGQEIKFQKENKNHSLKLNKILNNKTADITLRSEPINFLISVGEEKKFNLSSYEYYDFYIKLNEIKNNKSNLTLKEINEKILKEEDEKNLTEKKELTNQNEKKINNHKNIGGIIIVTLFLLFIFFVVKIVRKVNSSLKKEKDKKC